MASFFQYILIDDGRATGIVTPKILDRANSTARFKRSVATKCRPKSMMLRYCTNAFSVKGVSRQCDVRKAEWAGPSGRGFMFLTPRQARAGFRMALFLRNSIGPEASGQESGQSRQIGYRMDALFSPFLPSTNRLTVLMPRYPCPLFKRPDCAMIPVDRSRKGRQGVLKGAK